jgi:uncharacterized protein (TIGR02231 family)
VAELVAATRVARVVLFEDRVQVERVVDLPSEAGVHTLTLSGLSPLLQPHAVVCLATSAAVEEVRVERHAVAREIADEGRAADVRAALHHVEDRVTREQASHARRTLADSQAASSLAAAAAWMPRALIASDEPAEWAGALRELAETWERARMAQVEGKLLGKRLEDERAFWNAQLQAARRGIRTVEAKVIVRVQVRDATATLRLRYTIPCAVWRPVHRATLSDDSIAWELGAMCWNATGEDWTGVELSCSTARPGDDARPPTLSDDRLSTVRRGKEVVLETRDEDIALARPAGSARAEGVPGVDDGGEVRAFTAEHPVDLASTGRPIHIPLSTWSGAASVDAICMPELAADVVRRSRQTNGSSHPLLAGPVRLFGASGALGTTRIAFVAPGSPFELGWGSQDGLRVTRTSKRKLDTAALSGRKTLTFTIKLRVSNLSDAPATFTVRERVPVSELESVVVATPQASPPLGSGPDRDGFCEWAVTLAPGATKRLRFAYTVTAPRRVTLPF